MILIGPRVFGARVFLLNRAAGIKNGDGALANAAPFSPLL